MVKKKYTRPRTAMPVATKREVRIESRHSCVVCGKEVSCLELHHIDKNRDNHDLGNVILLCPTCHKRADKGEISPIELRRYKEIAREKTFGKELLKMRHEIDAITNSQSIQVSESFAKIKLKYHKLLSDYSDKLIFYQCFIYLIPEFYMDSRGDKVRDIVRNILNISPEEEDRILQHLQNLDIAKVVGGLLVLNDKKDAMSALNELIKDKRISLDDIVEGLITKL